MLALATLFTTTIIMSGQGAGSATANTPVQPPPPPVVGAVETGGGVITVKVWGSGVKGGSPGSGGGGMSYDSVRATCWMGPSDTGKAYFEYVDSGQFARDVRHQGETLTPRPGYETYKLDDKGRWWSSTCDSANWPNPSDTVGFGAFVDQFFAAHPVGFYLATDPPPAVVLAVPPELLREVAIKNLQLPDPKLDWNPKLKAGQGTLVTLDTWFWLDKSPTTLTVNAAAANNRASVTVTLDGMVIKADGETPLRCDGPGTPYVRGAQTACALAFSQASSRLGSQATHVTVNTRWAGTWTANGVEQGAISPQPDPRTADVNIQVDEVQTLVTNAR